MNPVADACAKRTLLSTRARSRSPAIAHFIAARDSKYPTVFEILTYIVIGKQGNVYNVVNVTSYSYRHTVYKSQRNNDIKSAKYIHMNVSIAFINIAHNFIRYRNNFNEPFLTQRTQLEL